MLTTLRDIFGFDAFRPNQEQIVKAIMNKEDCFVVMPTGGGKSLCYQLPAHLMEGTCLVISPLISLMKDQVDAACESGLRAAQLNSSLNAAERRRVTTALAQGKLDLLYVSPERFAMDDFMDILQSITLAFVAIDEAHCISEWGHDFRPDYLNLSRIIKDFEDLPVAAFTATATFRVAEDIIGKLKLRHPCQVRASFNRPNLFYQVMPKDDPDQQIFNFIRARPNESGIVYRTTRKAVDATAKFLRKSGIDALPYHAGLGDDVRARTQDAFSRDNVAVVVATIAFGMGIDKSNVRFVIHGDLPKNMESYYQETGRAGRDGEPAHCLLLFSYGDLSKIRFFIDKIEDKREHQHAVTCLNDMVSYATVNLCRRHQILGYFGEEYGESNCQTCDVCAGDVELVDATRDAQILMSAIARTGERFGAGHIVDVVTGADTEKIRRMGHNEIKTYGAGSDKDKRHWRYVLDNLQAQGLVAHSGDQYPTLALTLKSKTVLFKQAPVKVLKSSPPKRKRRGRAATDGPYNEELFEQLRALRRKIANEQNLPPFVIFSDKSLHAMARDFPTTDDTMLDVHGVGLSKFDRYGTRFIELIIAYLGNHPTARSDLAS